ncbi:hypothetical protein [Streptomyces sp. NPDC048361]|uniref:hypothetical protein n=1 Tax=Streptomyces sp. NPDC048361 TaxID=3154720 RepID=UPI00342CC47C
MKYVRAVWESGGFFLDPTAYLAILPTLCAKLPPGAWAFASDPAHYDMGHGNGRCVKDLELSGIRVVTDKSGELVLEFAPSRWKHDAGLRLRYSGVEHFAIDYECSIDWMEADTVLLDEILPAGGSGFTHEIALTDASITVRAADLQAEWTTTPDGSL